MVSILIDNDLQLRSLQPEDAPELFRAIEESRQHLRPWLAWVAGHTKPEHSQQFIQIMLQQQHEQRGLALGLFSGKTLIGEVGMHDWDQTLKKAHIGYWLCKDSEGKGILHSCLTRFIDFLFEKAALNKVEIQFSPANKRSARVAERLGFKVEGVLRQSHLRNGALEDLVVTGLLKNEWKFQNL